MAEIIPTEAARLPWRAEQLEGVWYVVREGDWFARVQVTQKPEVRIDQSAQQRAERIAVILNALAG